MRKAADDFFTSLVDGARERLRSGYYRVTEVEQLPRRSLVKAVSGSWRNTRLIAEVKFNSPAEGRLGNGDPVEIAKAYERGGAAAVSVLTEPEYFAGRLDYVTAIKRNVGVPVLMKDVVIDRAQVEAAKNAGADAILLIVGLFTRGLVAESMERMITDAHKIGLEVLLEAHREEEYKLALESEAEIVGINNRDLETLEVSLDVSRLLLSKYRRTKPVVCESGIRKREEIELLRALGADAFLVGSSLMRSVDHARAVMELVG